jgi:hypothetical protein
MNYEGLCADVLALDPMIRFSGICDRTGEIKYGGHREGIRSLLSPEDSKRSNLLALERWKLHSTLSPKTGKPRYAMEEYALVKNVTIALQDEHLLLVSLEVESQHGEIIEKIIKLVISRYVRDYI